MRVKFDFRKFAFSMRKLIGTAMIIFGVFYILRTAGLSDLDIIMFDEVLKGVLLGCGCVVFGGIISCD